MLSHIALKWNLDSKRNQKQKKKKLKTLEIWRYRKMFGICDRLVNEKLRKKGDFDKLKKMDFFFSRTFAIDQVLTISQANIRWL